MSLAEWELLQELTHSKVVQYLVFLENRLYYLEYLGERHRREATPCTTHCELDNDGHGGRVNACKACPFHPLRGLEHPIIDLYLLPPLNA